MIKLKYSKYIPIHPPSYGHFFMRPFIIQNYKVLCCHFTMYQLLYMIRCFHPFLGFSSCSTNNLQQRNSIWAWVESVHTKNLYLYKKQDCSNLLHKRLKCFKKKYGIEKMSFQLYPFPFQPCPLMLSTVLDISGLTYLFCKPKLLRFLIFFLLTFTL